VTYTFKQHFRVQFYGTITEILILVADFQGPEQKYLVTPAVINKLRLATEEFPEVEVKGLKAVITEQDGSEAAREKGRDEKASILIWGFYDETLNAIIHIELLREQRKLPDVTRRKQHRDQIAYTASAVSNPSLVIKESISGDMGLITLLLLGVIRYEAKDYDGAILRFSRALEQKNSSQIVDYQANLLLMRGRAYIYKGDNDRAIADYNKAIELDPKHAVAYYNRGIAYSDKGDNDHAIADFRKSLELFTKPSDREDALRQLQNLGVR
jgi:tetratricopeptide (TPR) repeat protein